MEGAADAGITAGSGHAAVVVQQAPPHGSAPAPTTSPKKAKKKKKGKKKDGGGGSQPLSKVQLPFLIFLLKKLEDTGAPLPSGSG